MIERLLRNALHFVVLVYLILVIPLSLWIAGKIYLAKWGVSHFAYPCIDTFQNWACDAVIGLLTP